MLPIIGKCLILLGASALGLQIAAGLRKRISCLKDFLVALERLERELCFALLPVETLLGQMKAGSRHESLNFFSFCEARFVGRGEERLEEIWHEALRSVSLPLREEDHRLLQEIGGVLGRYDGESQSFAFQRIHGRLETQIREAGEEAARMGKVYSVLGISIGVFCALML